jgi:beta-mannosidase
VQDDIISQETVELVFEGLDTLATVNLNNKKLGKTNNAFRTWKFDVKEVLLNKPSEINTLTITFNSSFKYAQSQ